MRPLTGLNVVLALAALLTAPACDREDAPPDEAVQTVDLGPPTPPPVPALPDRASLDTLAVLKPNRVTHVLVDPAGGVYFLQPAPDSKDILLKLGPRGVPETTALSASAVAEVAGARGLRNGTLAGLCAAPLPDGGVFFLFSGVDDAAKRSRFVFGRYDLRSAAMRVLADDTALRAAAGLGDSIELAQPALLATPRSVFLFLATPDRTAVLRMDYTRVPARGGHAPLDRAWPDGVLIDEVRERIALDRGDLQRFSPAGAASPDLLLVDGFGAGLFRVGPDGRGATVATLVGLPPPLSSAAPLDPATGRVAVFAADAEGEEIAPTVERRTDGARVRVTYPALILFDPSTPGAIVPAIGRERVTARPGLPVYALRLQQLVPEPIPDPATGLHSFLTYDAASGELMRLRLER